MIDNGYYICCNRKIQQITPTTTIIGIIYCRNCKTKHKVCIINGAEKVDAEILKKTIDELNALKQTLNK